MRHLQASGSIFCHFLSTIAIDGEPERELESPALSRQLGTPDNPATRCRVAPAGFPAEALARSGLGDFHHPALPLTCVHDFDARTRRAVVYAESAAACSPGRETSTGDPLLPLSPRVRYTRRHNVLASCALPFGGSHQHGPPSLRRVPVPSSSPTSSLLCSPPTPQTPSAIAMVFPRERPTTW